MGKKLSKKEILDELKKVIDPELGCNIVDLGLIYDVQIKDSQVRVKMTLTSPGCPLGGMIGREVENRLMKIKGMKKVKVDFVFDPPWTPARMSPELRTGF